MKRWLWVVLSGTDELLGLVDYSGNTDSNAPKLWGLFGDDRVPDFTGAYRVNSWDWACGGNGCAAGPDGAWPVSMVGMATAPGEALYIPERGPIIYSGDVKAMVLFAEAGAITLTYTRQDTVAGGYAVHIEGICLDGGLLGLYQAQVDGGGWHVSGHLPAIRNNQAIGAACGSEILVSIRDSGTFMDPRSSKDWW